MMAKKCSLILPVAFFLINVFTQLFAETEDEQADTPDFSYERGFYESPIEVVLSTNTENAEISFTLDASSPTETHGERYKAPITIKTTTVLRAIATKPGMRSSKIRTNTYIFADSVLVQHNQPAGYPATWAGHTADYEMDPDVVTGHESELKTGLKAIPIISIVTDRHHLFGAEGIYVNSQQSGREWERPTSVELIYPDGTEGFHENCGLRIHGGASRQPDQSPKHGFRFYFRDEYGPTRLRYDLFGGDATDEFDQLVLRSGYNNTWIHGNHVGSENQRGQALYVRDQWMRDTQLAMGHLSAHGMFVHLYLNGMYWGLFNLTERPEGAFAASYLGGDEKDFDTTNAGDFLNGDSKVWNLALDIAAGDMSEPQSYKMMQEFINIDNFIDYIILNHYAGNHDWDHHNWYGFRKRAKGWGFRFVSWDAEHVLEDAQKNKKSN